jgi:TonB family protein
MAPETGTMVNDVPVLPPRGKVMKICLVISLLVHLSMLLGIQKAFPVSWFPEPLRTYHVELIRPPIDPLNDEEASGADLAKIKPDESKPPEKVEDTISLDTKDKRYVSYAKVVKERLMLFWEYPREAKEKLIEGKVLVLFTLNRQGQLKDIKILPPSSFEILDRETLRTIRTASPFPPFPGSVTVKRLNIKASFAYRLTSRR